MAKEHFDIDASIVFQLGEDLITDVVQALVELVKNSYDADATHAKVTVDTEGTVPDEGSYFPNGKGYILIEDNGVGMDAKTLRQGWLTISKSPKRALKKAAGTTGRGRTPLGDKGLGRLGAQRLGFNIEIFTQPKSEKCIYHVGWSWNDFRGEATLSTVPVKWKKLDARGTRKTRILISDIREPEQWKSEGFRKIETQLSQMISPYSQFRDFEILGSFDGKEIELAEVSNRVRAGAQLRYTLSFDEEHFCIDGRARLDFIRPNSKKEAAAFEQLVGEDGGESFYAFLAKQKKADLFRVRLDKAKSWFVTFGCRRKFDEMPEIEREISNSGGQKRAVSPGPFSAEIDAFDLGAESVRRQNTFDIASEYRQLIKDLSGVRIYRDGFGVRAEQDWLGLGKQWTAGGSYYGLKPENTLGFVAITAKDNAALVETTDREGFKDTQAYRNFVRLFQEFTKFAHDAQEFLRRSWNDYRKEHERELAGVATDATAESLAEQVNTGLKNVASYKKPLEHIRSKLDQARSESEKTLKSIRDSAPNNSQLAKKVEQAQSNLDLRIDQVQEMAADLTSKVESTSNLQDVNRVLQGQIGTIQDQLELSVEAMSLGLTAETLVHEIANIVDRLADRTKAIASHLSRKKITDVKLLSYVEHVRSTANGLRRQLGHLTPSLKYARTRRDEIYLPDFCGELADYHNTRLQDRNIQVRVQEQSPFTVRINQGKLTQVLDNLILNSDYWLRQDIESESIDEGVITLRISEPFVRVSDNGMGIDPSVETSLFEPFVSHKKNGRGLGLYVAQQLLDAEGCSISVKRRRNDVGRLYIFEIDLSGCLVDGND